MRISQLLQLPLQSPRKSEGEPRRERVVTVGEVSACRDLLAPARAGFPPARLCVGSGSEWSSDPDRRVATGEE